MKWIVGLLIIMLLVVCGSRHSGRRSGFKGTHNSSSKVACARKFRYHSPHAMLDLGSVIETSIHHRICRR